MKNLVFIFFFKWIMAFNICLELSLIRGLEYWRIFSWLIGWLKKIFRVLADQDFFMTILWLFLRAYMNLNKEINDWILRMARWIILLVIPNIFNQNTYCEPIVCFGYYDLYDENIRDGPMNFSPSIGLGFYILFKLFVANYVL